MKQYVDTFQSPRPDTVDRLFASIIGIKSLSSHWAWMGMSCEEAKRCVNVLLNLRGDLVHTSNLKKRETLQHDRTNLAKQIRQKWQEKGITSYRVTF